jgi:DNA-binding winged helix-turn-helix (wHTH) protein/pimeloyl-ACP methyl ester carboxylesterase
MGDQTIELRPKAFDVLRHLAENPGRLVPKQELYDAVWPNVVVSDDSLVQCIRELRQKLGDTEHHLIKTVSRRGYLLDARPMAGSKAETPAATASLPPAPPRPRAATEQRVTFCRTSDGVNIAVARVGRGRPVVRMPYIGSHVEYDWENPAQAELLQFLADRFELIRYDGRGTGLSDRNVTEVSFETFKRDLDAVVEALDLPHCAFVGHGPTKTIGPAIAYAVRHPERVSKLVIHGGVTQGAQGSNYAWWTPFVWMITKDWDYGSLGYVRSYLAEMMPGLSPEQVKASVDWLPKITSLEIALRTLAATASTDVAGLLAQVRVPTLVLHCRDARLHNVERAQSTAAAIANASLVSLATANDTPLPGEAAWPVFLGALETFLSEG